MQRRLAALCGFVLLASVSGAVAAPIVSVDVDPGTPGVQDSRIVSDGASFEVDIVISGVEASAPLNAFEFDLLFDSSVLSATSVVDGGFLLDPVFIVEEDVGVMSVAFAEVTLGPGGATGAGSLATVSFEAVGTGTSLLDLSDVLLSAPFGVEIPVEAVNDGSVTVAGSGAAPIPEPSSAILYAVGGLLVAHRVRRGRALH